MKTKASKGACTHCGKEYTRAGMAKHLAQCLIDRLQTAQGKTGPCFHLQVAARFSPIYWLHLQADANTTLKSLDGFLRKIWLECCGHLSKFTIERRSYLSYEEDLEESTAQKLRDAVCSYDGDCSAVNDDTKRVVCKDVPELRKLYGEKTSTKITDIIKGAINSFKEEEQPSGICIAVDKEEQKSDFLRSIGKIFLPNGSAEQQNQAGIFALIGLFLILVIFMRK